MRWRNPQIEAMQLCLYFQSGAHKKKSFSFFFGSDILIPVKLWEYCCCLQYTWDMINFLLQLVSLLRRWLTITSLHKWQETKSYILTPNQLYKNQTISVKKILFEKSSLIRFLNHNQKKEKKCTWSEHRYHVTS